MGRRVKEISGKEDEEEKKLIGLWRVIIFILLLPDGIIETQFEEETPPPSIDWLGKGSVREGDLRTWGIISQSMSSQWLLIFPRKEFLTEEDLDP